MMDGFIIRDYRDGDYEQVRNLWTVTGLTYPERGDNEESIKQCLSIGGRFLVMTTISVELVIGTSWMTFDGRRIYLHHFGILPGYQGKGLGTKLAHASLKYVKSAGYQVKLEVHRENTIATHIYNKLGFISFSDYDIYMIRDVQNIIIPED